MVKGVMGVLEEPETPAPKEAPKKLSHVSSHPIHSKILRRNLGREDLLPFM